MACRIMLSVYILCIYGLNSEPKPKCLFLFATPEGV